MAARSAWYELRGGRRHVVPYDHEFTCHAKGRWVGRTVLEVLSNEFPDEFSDAASIEAAAAGGRLVLNGKAARADDKFGHGDKLLHSIRRHEPSVPAAPIEILLCDDDLLALSKPAGMPVHHAGRYRRNSLVEILQAERPELGLGNGRGGGLHILHRLDRQVSGVLLLPRTSAASAVLNEALRDGRMRKRYLARVRGAVPPGATLCITAPIRVRSSGGSTVTDCCAHAVGDDCGKHATTLVRGIGHDEASGTSLVLCEPITGRSHQLRLHLQRIGHSIVDDPLYGAARAASM